MNKFSRLTEDISTYLSNLSRRRDGSRQFVPESWPRGTRQRVRDKRELDYLDFEIRRKTTDWSVFTQIFLQEDYRLAGLRQATGIQRRYQDMLGAGDTPLVVDCGANNGLSCAWFSRTYPEAFVVGVEPEIANYGMAVRNTRALGNAILLNAAVAAHDGVLAVSDPGHGTSGFITTEVPPGISRGTIPAYSIASLIGLAAKERPDSHLVPFIVKIDIEGYEAELFGGNTEWIDEVPVIIIELHDWLFPGRHTSESFLKAIAVRQRDFVLRGENVFSIACEND